MSPETIGASVGESSATPVSSGVLTERPQTFGEKAVGLSFNPSGDSAVHKMKELFAQIIDVCHEARVSAGQGEKSRMYSIAITEAQTAQMWAVKAMTAKE